MVDEDFCDGCCYRVTCDHDLEKCCYLVRNHCSINEHPAINSRNGRVVLK